MASGKCCLYGVDVKLRTFLFKWPSCITVIPIPIPIPRLKMKGGARISDDVRLKFLAKVQENKDVLFGQFSDKLTKKDKIEKWTMILNYMRAINYPLPPNADFTYIRDTVWQNFRKRVQGKYFRLKLEASTDGAGPADDPAPGVDHHSRNDSVVFNEVEKNVLEILALDTTNLIFEEPGTTPKRQKVKHEPRQEIEESNEDFSVWLRQNSKYFDESQRGVIISNGEEENEEKLKLLEIRTRIEKTELEKELLRFQIEKTKLEVLLLTKKFGETEGN
uniref:Regulatory protein zeste n=1 Tax=Romanomermis culicivorax TaxID=13658 RepID=A0A915IS12_ROMCU